MDFFLNGDCPVATQSPMGDPTDGLTQRTASRPERCDDAVIAALVPVGRYIVDAQLVRTRITDTGLRSLTALTLDLSHTAVSPTGLRELAARSRLEALHLTATAVDDAGIRELRKRRSLKHVYVSETRLMPDTTSRVVPLR